MAQILGKPKPVAAEEVQLWRKHLLPVKEAAVDVQKAAVAAWFDEMKLLGLSEASRDEVGAFLGEYSASRQA